MTIVTDNTRKGVITYGEGVIEKITIRDANENQFGITHRAGIKLSGGDEWVNYDIKCKAGQQPNIRYKEGEQWFTLCEGDEVSAELVVGEYNGKATYKTTSTRLSVTKRGDGKQSSGGSSKSGSVSSGGGTQFVPKDNSGVTAGNGFNCAAKFLAHNKGGGLVPTACDFIDLADELKEAYKDTGDAYTVGARVGMALLYAAEQSKSMTEVATIARGVIEDKIPALVEYAKTKKRPEASDKQTKTKATAKAVVKEPEVVDEFYDDDDIPF